MKKTFPVFILVLLLTSLSSFAQNRNYHFGLQVSPNISWMKPEVEQVVYKSDGAMVGVSYGAIFENYFTPNVAFLTGINILQTGGHLKYPYINTTLVGLNPVKDTGVMERKYNLQYLEIPLILKGSTGELLGKFSFYGQFGIGSGFNVKAKAENAFLSDHSATGEKEVTQNINVKKDISFFRESLIIGIGAEYRLGKTAIAFAGISFSNGFTDALKSSASFNPAIKEKARVNCVDLNIGIVF